MKRYAVPAGELVTVAVIERSAQIFFIYFFKSFIYTETKDRIHSNKNSLRMNMYNTIQITKIVVIAILQSPHMPKVISNELEKTIYTVKDWTILYVNYLHVS